MTDTPSEQSRVADEIVEKFAIEGRLESVRRYGCGHINDTFLSSFESPEGSVRYVHQRINGEVFRSPPAVMQNIERVTAHIRTKLQRQGLDPGRRVLQIVPTRDGKNCLLAQDGQYWRTYLNIEGARTYDRSDDPALVFNVGEAFAKFQLMLLDLPGEPLNITIPDFGDPVARIRSLRTAVAHDKAGRLHGSTREVGFAAGMERLAVRFGGLMAAPGVPVRNIHFDTKINNVMIDDITGEGICVIDLDTVMPGAVIYDFGDCARSCTCRVSEDLPEGPDKVFDLMMFEQLAAGYLGVAKRFLTPGEVGGLVDASIAVALIAGIRFLTDHLSNDTYFRISREGQNLDRCRTQFALVEAMESCRNEMQKIVSAYSQG